MEFNDIKHSKIIFSYTMSFKLLIFAFISLLNANYAQICNQPGMCHVSIFFLIIFRSHAFTAQGYFRSLIFFPFVRTFVTHFGKKEGNDAWRPVKAPDGPQSIHYFIKLFFGESAKHFMKIFIIRFPKNIKLFKSGLKWSIPSSLKFTT